MTVNPFSAEAVAAAASPLFEIRTHGGCVYWLTRRPSEGGRQVVMEYNPELQSTRCLTAEGYSVQSRVHEYGGGSYAVGNAALFFVNGDDQCLYQQALDKTTPPKALTAPSQPARSHRYGDITVSHNGTFLIAVREQHTDHGVINDLIRFDLNTQRIDVLASGDDFYASPALNRDDNQLTFLSWCHPDMPWEKTKLWQLDLNTGESNLTIDQDEAIYQPGFTEKNALFYVSDRSGWWNLYLDDKATPALPKDCGYPMWVLGTNQVIFSGEKAWMIAGASGEQQIIDHQGIALPLPFNNFQPSLATDDSHLYFIAGTYNQPDALYQFNLDNESLHCIAKSAEHDIDPALFSKPECLQLTQDGETIFGFYYAPTHTQRPASLHTQRPASLHTQRPAACPRGPEKMDPAHKARDVEEGARDIEGDELPPLIVNCHGGPNGSSTTQCQFKIQFWTSRGFAYLDVNYRGSTGYGRDFRRALAGKWGVADVEDCCALAQHCIEEKRGDPNRLFIRGQSAGGLTALSACVFHNLFTKGTSCYGVADLTTLIDDTHKFEARYLDKLVGPYPEKRDYYLQRSPAYHLDQLQVPLLFLQGLEDRVVPVEQTKAMTDKLDACNKPYQYVEFTNEGHGFKRAENIIRALEAELAFYDD